MPRLILAVVGVVLVASGLAVLAYEALKSKPLGGPAVVGPILFGVVALVLALVVFRG